MYRTHMYMIVDVCIHTHACIPICISTYPSFHLAVYLSIYLSISHTCIYIYAFARIQIAWIHIDRYCRWMHEQIQTAVQYHINSSNLTDGALRKIQKITIQAKPRHRKQYQRETNPLVLCPSRFITEKRTWYIRHLMIESVFHA